MTTTRDTSIANDRAATQVTTSDRHSIDRRLYCLLVAPVAVLAVSELALFKIVPHGSAVISKTYSAARANAALIELLSAFLLMTGAVMGSLALCWTLARRHLTRAATKELLLVAGTIIGAILIAIQTAKSGRIVGADWVLLGTAPKPCPASANNAEIFRDCGVQLVGALLKGSSILVCLAAASVIFGSIIELSRVWQTAPQDRDIEAARAALDRWLLVLVCGLAYHYAWGKWLGMLWVGYGNEGKAVEKPPAELQDFMSVVRAFTVYNGARFSCFIASYHLPILYLIWTLGGDQKRDTTALVATTIDTIKTAFGILAPFLASILAPLASGL
jgi:hypothetical protein